MGYHTPTIKKPRAPGPRIHLPRFSDTRHAKIAAIKGVAYHKIKRVPVKPPLGNAR